MHSQGRLRYVHLVRHGQYVHEPDVFGGVLTRTGRAQAACLARYLATLSIERIRVSDMNRAIETAAIISAALPGVPVEQDRILREVLPTSVPGRRVPRSTVADSRDRLQKIEKRYLRRTDRLRHEVIVCHGNLIRSLVARQLRTPGKTWMVMDVHHCGVTTLKFPFDGPARLVRFNDFGHLPPELILQE